MPSTIQIALLIEVLVNVPSAAILVFFPTWALPQLLPSAASLTASTITLAQAVGVFLLCITAQVAMTIPNGPHAAESRRLVYWLNGIGEAVMIPLLLMNDPEAVGGFSTGVCAQGAKQMMPLLAWRAFVLWVKPAWLEGRRKVDAKKL